jgi:ribonuclease R
MAKNGNKRRQGRDYDFPIPERKDILKFLNARKKPQTLKKIAENLGVKTSDERAALNNRLKAMLQDGQLIKTRREGYGLVDKMDLIPGKVLGHPDGFGFLRPDEGDEDLFIHARQMRSLLHGDRVLVRIKGHDRRGRPEAGLVEVLERANTSIVGRYYEEKNVGFVVPDNKRIHQDIFIPQGQSGGASPGQFVVAEITRQPDKHTQPVGKIIELLTMQGARDTATEIAIRAYDLPYEWPQAVDDEIATLNPESLPAVLGREDIRDLPLVTIDGEDARDFDDAVYCERQGSGWRLLVAIADVSHYVKPGSALDEEANLRGTSVYFPQRVIPMLPEVLSNELCSLKPNVDRLCMVCELDINKSGKVKSFRFFEGIMRSAARLTYDEVEALAISKSKEKRNASPDLITHLDDLYALYELMHIKRIKNGLLDFDTTESKISFDNAGNISEILPLKRNDAHRLIEEFMLAANIAAAEFLLNNELPALYRNHGTPDEDKLDNLRTFLTEFALMLSGGNEPTSRDYSLILDKVKDREYAHLIETVMLRSMQLAVYSEKNGGHFGLGFEAYTHFTSPIRRYPDLLVHRAIRSVISDSQSNIYLYSKEAMHQLGASCSMAERRAEDASRDVVQRLKCEYMKDKIGEIFFGTVSSVTGFGLFVELDDIYIEGLVHVTALPNDYYHFDNIGHQLVGEQSKTTFRLGNRLKVALGRVDVDEKKIDFELVELL